MQETKTQVWSLGKKDSLTRAWQPTAAFLPGESHRQRSLADYSPRGCKELDTTEWLTHHCFQFTSQVRLKSLESSEAPSSSLSLICNHFAWNLVNLRFHLHCFIIAKLLLTHVWITTIKFLICSPDSASDYIQQVLSKPSAYDQNSSYFQVSINLTIYTFSTQPSTVPPPNSKPNDNFQLSTAFSFFCHWGSFHPLTL